MEPKNENVVTGVLAHLMRFFADLFKSVAESLLVVVGTFFCRHRSLCGHAMVLRVATVYCTGGWLHCSWGHAGFLVRRLGLFAVSGPIHQDCKSTIKKS